MNEESKKGNPSIFSKRAAPKPTVKEESKPATDMFSLLNITPEEYEAKQKEWLRIDNDDLFEPLGW